MDSGDEKQKSAFGGRAAMEKSRKEKEKKKERKMYKKFKNQKIRKEKTKENKRKTKEKQEKNLLSYPRRDMLVIQVDHPATKTSGDIIEGITLPRRRKN